MYKGVKKKGGKQREKGFASYNEFSSLREAIKKSHAHIIPGSSFFCTRCVQFPCHWIINDETGVGKTVKLATEALIDGNGRTARILTTVENQSESLRNRDWTCYSNKFNFFSRKKKKEIKWRRQQVPKMETTASHTTSLHESAMDLGKITFSFMNSSKHGKWKQFICLPTSIDVLCPLEFECVHSQNVNNSGLFFFFFFYRTEWQQRENVSVATVKSV